MSEPKRKDFMSLDQQTRWRRFEERMGGPQPRTHQNCLEVLEVGRPGKTAKDRYKKQKNQ